MSKRWKKRLKKLRKTFRKVLPYAAGAALIGIAGPAVLGGLSTVASAATSALASRGAPSPVATPPFAPPARSRETAIADLAQLGLGIPGGPPTGGDDVDSAAEASAVGAQGIGGVPPAMLIAGAALLLTVVLLARR